MPIAQYIAPSKLKMVESPAPESLKRLKDGSYQLCCIGKKQILTKDDMISEREVCRLNFNKTI